MQIIIETNNPIHRKVVCLKKINIDEYINLKIVNVASLHEHGTGVLAREPRIAIKRFLQVLRYVLYSSMNNFGMLWNCSQHFQKHTPV